MYAIIRTGGKQYTVKPGDVVHVAKLANELGSEFDLTDILMIGGEATHLGLPVVKNAKVTVVVTKQAKTRKIIVFKKKRRHSYRNFNTHRQEFTALFVKSITGPDGQSVKAEGSPKVMDMTALRADRITAKQEAAQARREDKDETPAAPKKSAAPKKAKTAAKKKTAGKKSAVKKTAKKTKKA